MWILEFESYWLATYHFQEVLTDIDASYVIIDALRGCETWSFTFREEHRLRVFENRVLRRIFGPKSDTVMGKWRKLHSAEPCVLYSSPNIIRQIKSRRMRWTWHVARMGEGRTVYKVLMGKPGGKRPLGRPKRRWEDGIRMDLGEIGWGGCGVDSTGSGQGPVAGCCECGDERAGSGATELVWTVAKLDRKGPWCKIFEWAPYHIA
jgi:hypothetical protein